MDLFNSFPISASIIILLLTISLFLLSFGWISKLLSSHTNQKPKPPEPGGGWPIIGHLLLLGGSEPLHITLSNMADKYGPIFTIKLGVRRALVVNDCTAVRECLTTNDRAFASRPNLAITKHMENNFAFAPYGPFWRQIRKLVTLQLLSNKRLDTIKDVQYSEIRLSMQELYQRWNKSKRDIGSCDGKLLIDMNTWFRDLTLNLITRTTIGKRISGTFDYNDENKHDIAGFKKAIKDFVILSGKFMISDAFPILGRLNIGGSERALKMVFEEIERVMEKWLQEHKNNKASADEGKGEQNFMAVMLSALTDMDQYKAESTNKNTCLGLIIAAEDTTRITLTWALSLLLNHPDKLEKVQNELDTIVGKKRLVNESDLKNLVYLEVVIKETMRLYPAAPLSLIHEAIEDCTVSGYQVRAGTWLITNLYKIQRDPEIWLDPLEFRPERFLSSHKHVDVKGQNFELIPFGSGRRICPGISYALHVLKLTLANLLHWFDFAIPGDEPIDMQQAISITLAKATPLEILITPRLSPLVYELPSN